MMEFAPDAFVGVNCDGRIVLVNYQTEVLFGYDRGELLGRSVELLVPERLRDGHASSRAGYFAQPRTRPMVEDEQALREVTRRILSGGGYRVIAAANGPEALAVASDHAGQIDLLLTDVIMPQMPGTQLARRMCEQLPSLQVLFMSGFAQPILDSTELFEDRVQLIEKPFSAPELLAKIEEVLRR